MATEQLQNYINGAWQRSRPAEFLDVRNPATAETLVRVPITPREEVDAGGEYIYSHATTNAKRAVPGRRQELGDRAARRRYGDEHPMSMVLPRIVWLVPKEKWMAMFWVTSSGATVAFKSVATRM
jgi:hypothetical protein